MDENKIKIKSKKRGLTQTREGESGENDPARFDSSQPSDNKTKQNKNQQNYIKPINSSNHHIFLQQQQQLCIMEKRRVTRPDRSTIQPPHPIPSPSPFSPSNDQAAPNQPIVFYLFNFNKSKKFFILHKQHIDT